MNMTHERLTSPCLIMFQGAIYSVQPKLISLFRFISSCSLGLRFQVCSDWDIGSVCFFQFLSSQAQFTCGNKMNRMKHMKQCSNCFRFKHNHWVHGLSMAFLHAVQGKRLTPLLVLLPAHWVDQNVDFYRGLQYNGGMKDDPNRRSDMDSGDSFFISLRSDLPLFDGSSLLNIHT